MSRAFLSNRLMPGSPRANRFSNGSRVPCTDSQANEIPSPSCSTAFAHQITCPRVASVVASVGVGAQHGVSGSVPSRVFHVFQSKAFLARLSAFFLAATAAFFRILRLNDFLMDFTRSLGVSQGPVPGSSEKGNSCANSALLTSGVNLSLFLVLGVRLGLGGTGGFLPGLEGPQGEALCFIPWVALTNCVNHAYTGPASKSSSPGVVAPVARTPLVGAPNRWLTFWSNGVIDDPRLRVEVVSRHRGYQWPRAHVWPPNPRLWSSGYLPPILVCTCLVIVKKQGHCPLRCSPSLVPWCN